MVDVWPGTTIRDYERVRTSQVETLLVGGELDFATPPQNATEQLLPHLPNGHEVVIPHLGHSTSFWGVQPEAGTQLVNTFFDSGRVDDSLYEPISVDFTAAAPHTALAKGIAGGMIGVALLMVLSLAWMALRVRRRAHGRKAAAVLRSVYAFVLGLGGWFLGVLIVLTTESRTPLDSELLATISVGAPVGVGIYLAWMNRDWSAGTKLAGFSAAAAGALLGAWLGFSAATDLLALITAIVGAVAGANLALIGLDVAWDARARDRFATAEKVEAHPVTGT
jgi:hypothetical protein